MSIDAVAILHCSDRALLAKMEAGEVGEPFAEQLRRVQEELAGGREPPMALALAVLRVGRDCAFVYTGARFQGIASDPPFARALAQRVVALLPAGAHADDVVHFYPDAGEIAADDYAAAIAECQGASVSVSLSDRPAESGST